MATLPKKLGKAVKLVKEMLASINAGTISPDAAKTLDSISQYILDPRHNKVEEYDAGMTKTEKANALSPSTIKRAVLYLQEIGRVERTSNGYRLKQGNPAPNKEQIKDGRLLAAFIFDFTVG